VDVNAKIDELIEIVEAARAMPMSSSCVINRSQVLDLLDDLKRGMPEEIDRAREVLAPMQQAWAAGDRKAATAAIPVDVIDDLVVHGAPEDCREQVRAYADAGVTTPVIALLPTPDGPPTLDLLRALGPVS